MFLNDPLSAAAAGSYQQQADVLCVLDQSHSVPSGPPLFGNHSAAGMTSIPDRARNLQLTLRLSQNVFHEYDQATISRVPLDRYALTPPYC